MEGPPHTRRSNHSFERPSRGFAWHLPTTGRKQGQRHLRFRAGSSFIRVSTSVSETISLQSSAETQKHRYAAILPDRLLTPFESIAKQAFRPIQSIFRLLLYFPLRYSERWTRLRYICP